MQWKQFLDFHKILYKDLKLFLVKQAERIKAHAQKAAADSGRPYEYFEGPVATRPPAARPPCAPKSCNPCATQIVFATWDDSTRSDREGGGVCRSGGDAVGCSWARAGPTCSSFFLWAARLVRSTSIYIANRHFREYHLPHWACSDMEPNRRAEPTGLFAMVLIGAIGALWTTLIVCTVRFVFHELAAIDFLTHAGVQSRPLACPPAPPAPQCELPPSVVFLGCADLEEIKCRDCAAQSARIVPSVRDGKANGIKLYAIRPSSPFARLGLQNGDTVTAIDGEPLDPDSALRAYTRVLREKKATIDIERHGIRHRIIAVFDPAEALRCLPRYGRH